MKDTKRPIESGPEHAVAKAVQYLIYPVEQFLRTASAGGILLLLSSGAALLLANSPWHEYYEHLLHLRLKLEIGSFVLDDTLIHWINDGLMTLFFFFIGMEIKRELTIGELSTPKKATLPIVAAMGGMLLPAGIFLLFNYDEPTVKGWGIPMATDIAFAVGILVLLTRSLPISLKVFLLALAIVDDLGAVLVIAFFYTEQISGPALGAAALLFGVMALVRYIGVRRIWISGVIGFFIWLAFFKSGVHSTIAGVLLGLLTPQENWVRPPVLAESLKNLTNKVVQSIQRDSKGEIIDPANAPDLVKDARDITRAISPLNRLVYDLHPWISFVVVPVFAFANAGIPLKDIDPNMMLTSPLPMGIFFGLLIGKPLGIFSFSWVATKLGLGEIPKGATWTMIAGVSCLGGIGFTMALFINSLAFENPQLMTYSKMGIFTASIVSAVLGYSILKFSTRGNPDDSAAPPA